MFRGRFLLILLAVSITAPPAPAHAQASATPQIVLPPLSTVKPLEVGPPRGPKDEVELSASPVDYDVEHPLLVAITVFQEEPAPENERRSDDPSSSRFDWWSTRVSTDGTRTGSSAWGYINGSDEYGPPGGATSIPPDAFAKIKSLIVALPPDHGRIPPRNRKVQVEIATRYGTETRIYDAANLPRRHPGNFPADRYKLHSAAEVTSIAEPGKIGVGGVRSVITDVSPTCRSGAASPA